MNKSLMLCLVMAACVVITPGCKKKTKGCMDPNSISYDPQADEDDGSCKYAGIGGSTTIVAKPEHHGDPIIGKVGYPDSAFVKFNTLNSPGTNPAVYDLIIAGKEGEDHVHIEGLKPGKYFIFMTGFDSTIVKRVSGGIPYTLTQASGEVDVAVPVSE